jgi:hypothetical protein
MWLADLHNFAILAMKQLLCWASQPLNQAISEREPLKGKSIVTSARVVRHRVLVSDRQIIHSRGFDHGGEIGERRAVEIVLDGAEECALTALVRKHSAPQSVAHCSGRGEWADQQGDRGQARYLRAYSRRMAQALRSRARGQAYDEPRPARPVRSATTRSPRRSAKRWRRAPKARHIGA